MCKLLRIGFDPLKVLEKCQLFMLLKNKALLNNTRNFPVQEGSAQVPGVRDDAMTGRLPLQTPGQAWG